MNRTDAAAAYRKARNVYLNAARVSLAGDDTDRAFEVLVRDWLPDLEVVTVHEGREIVGERKATFAEWADAAWRAAGEFCDRYTVRNALDPLADWQWEQTERLAGRSW